MTGTVLLKIARLLFDDAVLNDVVIPTLADLQQEVAAAGASRVRRAAARWRGYCAFWVLVALAPVAFVGWRPHRRVSLLPPGAAIAAVMLASLAFAPPSLRGFLLLTLVGGTVVAVVIHAWYRRHPSEHIVPASGQRRPEINLSSIPVQANVGGLIFMVGSVFIVIAGIPTWRWFFFAAALGGVLTGAILFAWHARHPSRGLPENHIVLR